MIAVVIIGFSAVCFCLVGIGLSLDHVGAILEYISEHMKEYGADK